MTTHADIYAAYPRHVGKAAAMKKIAKAVSLICKERGRGCDDAAAWLLERVRVYSAARAGQERQYTPHPATWFHQGRYDDDESEWDPPQTAGRPLANGLAGAWGGVRRTDNTRAAP